MKDPDMRYQTMEEFARVLDAISLDDKTVIQRKKVSLKRKWLWIAAGCLIFIASILILFSRAIDNGLFPVIGSRLSDDQDENNRITAEPENVSSATSPVPESQSEYGSLIIYDDFDTGDQINPLLWDRNTDFQIEDGYAVLKVFKGEEESDRAGLAPTNRWTVSGFGSTRFWIESKIQVSSSAANSANAGSAGMQLTGPIISTEGLWYFHLGYTFDGSSMAYVCGGSKTPSGPNLYWENFGYAGLSEWHTFRVSIEEVEDSDNLAVVSYVDGERVCYTVPPTDWQESIARGDTVSFYLLSGWSNAWDVEEPFVLYFDDVDVGTFRDESKTDTSDDQDGDGVLTNDEIVLGTDPNKEEPWYDPDFVLDIMTTIEKNSLFVKNYFTYIDGEENYIQDHKETCELRSGNTEDFAIRVSKNLGYNGKTTKLLYVLWNITDTGSSGIAVPAVQEDDSWWYMGTFHSNYGDINGPFTSFEEIAADINHNWEKVEVKNWQGIWEREIFKIDSETPTPEILSDATSAPPD